MYIKISLTMGPILVRYTGLTMILGNFPGDGTYPRHKIKMLPTAKLMMRQTKRSCFPKIILRRGLPQPPHWSKFSCSLALRGSLQRL